jgi:two-component system response regulator DesR
MIRTFVAEPVTLTREGLVALLGRENDIDLLAAAQRAEDVIPTARQLKPDVALISDAFPGQDGILTARSVCAELPRCRCAILSHTRDPRHLEHAFAAQLDGYLVHDCAAEFLCAAIRQLAVGNKVIDPGLAFRMVAIKACPLTIREAEALRAAAKGFTTTEIAAGLCLAAGTVRNYLSRAIAKVGARNRVDAIRIAEESGWL